MQAMGPRWQWDAGPGGVPEGTPGKAGLTGAGPFIQLSGGEKGCAELSVGLPVSADTRHPMPGGVGVS